MQHEVFEHDLGGAKGLVVHVPGAQVVSLVVRFNSGYHFTDFTHYELPHVLEHLVAGGTSKNFPRHSELSIEIEKNGAYHNAHTSADSNWYVFECGEFEKDRILDLLPEYFTEQLFTPEDLAVEIANVRQELTRNITDHARQRSILFHEQAYPDYSLNFQARIDRLPNITRENTVEYYLLTHTWDNLRFYIAGEFPDGGEKVVAQLAEKLRGLPRGKRNEPGFPIGRSFAPVVEYRDIDHIYYQLGWFGKGLPEELWPAAVILRTALGEGWASKIFGKARDRGLVYAISTFVDFDPGSTDFGFAGFVTSDNIIDLFHLVRDEVVDVRDGGITEVEIEAAKALRVGTRIRSTQTADQLIGWYMNKYEESERVEPFGEWSDKLSAVTRGQVIEVARHLCGTDARGSVFLGRITDSDAKKYAAILDPISKL